MDNMIKEMLINACKQNKIIKIDHASYATSESDGSYGYETRDNGDILRSHYIITGAKNCGCFGCDFIFEQDSSEVIGNCNNLSFLS